MSDPEKSLAHSVITPSHHDLVRNHLPLKGNGAVQGRRDNDYMILNGPSDDINTSESSKTTHAENQISFANTDPFYDFELEFGNTIPTPLGQNIFDDPEVTEQNHPFRFLSRSHSAT